MGYVKLTQRRNSVNKVTLVIQDPDSNSISLIHTRLAIGNSAEEKLKEWEETNKPSDLHSIGAYRYALVGVIKGHVNWTEKYNDNGIN